MTLALEPTIEESWWVRRRTPHRSQPARAPGKFSSTNLSSGKKVESTNYRQLVMTQRALRTPLTTGAKLSARRVLVESGPSEVRVAQCSGRKVRQSTSATSAGP